MGSRVNVAVHEILLKIAEPNMGKRYNQFQGYLKNITKEKKVFSFFLTCSKKKKQSRDTCRQPKKCFSTIAIHIM